MDSGRNSTFPEEGERLLRDMSRYDDGDGALRAERPRSATAHDRRRETNEQTTGRSLMTSSQSLFQELERPAMARKKTRAVFDDLGTAHSIITGSGRSRFRSPFSTALAVDEESPTSILLQDLSRSSPLDRLSFPRHDESITGLLPTLPKPAAVSNWRRSRTPDDENSPFPAAKRLSRPRSWFGQRSKGATHSSSPKPPSQQVSWGTTLGSIKSAIASFTELGAGNDRSDGYTASHWHRGSASNIAEAHGSKKRYSASLETYDSLETVADSDYETMDASDIRTALRPNEFSYYHSSSGGPPSDTLPPHAVDRCTGSDGFAYSHFQSKDARGLSIRDGSTVGNIYAHYMEGEDEDLSDDDAHSPGSRKYVNTRASNHGFPSSPPLLPRSRYSLPNKSAQPPNFSLPKSVSDQHLGVQHQAVPSSSQPLSHRSSYENTDLLLDVPQAIQSASGGNALNKAKNGPQLVNSLIETAIAHPIPAHEQFVARKRDRLPLEKEVSRALRRASGFSGYSVGSNDTSILHEPRYEEASEASTYRAVKSLIGRNMELGASSAVQADAPPTRGFYDEHAIPSDWVATQRQTVVRVPINPPSLPASPPNSLVDDEPLFIKQDDANDWETVGESVGRPLPTLLGGTVGRAGSSIANYSDESARELSSFNSMDRIAQHPSNMAYSGDYRQRDLKKTRIPVFLPVFQEHKVNGYLADSTRFRPPPNPFYKTPLPLHRPHVNPFLTPAPAVTPSQKNQRPQNTSVFPPTDLTRVHKQLKIGGPGANRGKEKARAIDRPGDDEWMKEFGDPGPVINSQSDKVFRATAPEYLSTPASVISYDSPHPHVGMSSAARDSKVLEWRSEQENQVDKLTETGDHGGKYDRKKTRNPFGKRPPGAFYQNLRAVSGGDGKGVGASHQQSRGRASTKNGSIKDYPTNTLRPLSLLKDRRPSTPQGQTVQASNRAMENDFVYRSPLAPPRRSSWKHLYDENQMKEIKEAAKADGFFGSQSSLSANLRSSTRNVNSQKQLFEAPRLAVFSRNASDQTGLMHQKTAFSTVVLCLCSLFPPLLILYATGSLDGLVIWWTRDQCSTFGKGHKRAAAILLYVWGLFFLIAMIVSLIVWFAVIRPHQNI